MGMRVIALESEIGIFETEDILHLRINLHDRQRTRFAGYLETSLLEMVEIEVGVAESVDEIARLKVAYLRHHLEQKGVGGDVERDAEEAVGTALVELKTQLAVGDVELEKGMARRQLHVREVGDVPCADNYAARVGIVFYVVDSLGNLVDGSAVVVGPGAPLIAVDMSEIAILVRPLVPYPYAVFLKVMHVGVAFEKPQKLMDDGLEMQFLGCYERKAVGEAEAHLIAEYRECSGTRSVGLYRSVLEDMLEQINVLFHL